MKKQQLALSSAGLLLLSTGVISEDSMIAGAMSQRKPCEFANSAKKEVGEENIHDQWQGKSAPYLKKSGWITSVDFLYWRADEEGTEYVTQFSSTDVISNSNSKISKPTIKWEPGFKLGIGYTFGSQDFWDLFFRWTYLNSHQTNSHSGEGIQDQSGDGIVDTLQPWWVPALVGQFAKDASVAWDLRYNVFDLELGRDYFVSRTLSLRPHVGLRGAAIFQNYHAKYTGILVPENEDPAILFPSGYKTTNDFGGIGVRAGTKLQWNFTRHWAIVGSFSGSLLYGHFDIKNSMTGISSDHSVLSKTEQELSKIAPNLEASLGFAWDLFFGQNRHVSLMLAYEFSEWFSQNQMNNAAIYDNSLNNQKGVTTRINSQGDLSLQGGTLELRFDY